LLKWLAAALGAAVAAYAAYVGAAWIDYGRPRPPGPDEIDPLLDRFMPVYDIAERDTTARIKFRRYWSLFSPGIITVRWVALQPVKAEAERRASEVRASLSEK
jgi:hypothetical protein